MTTKQEYVKVPLSAILDKAGGEITGKRGNTITYVEVAAVDVTKNVVMYRILYTPKGDTE